MVLQDVYIFDKTGEYVIDMLETILSGSEKVSSRQEFINCAELTLEPAGWTAMWKLSKEKCHEFNVRYPCSVDVTVTSMDFSSLTAYVFIDPELNGCIDLPESVADVPLNHLWAKIIQPIENLDVQVTARFIDLLRFFYDNIWWPWETENECYTWKIIQNRVNLWEDIARGVLPSTITQHLTEIRQEAFDTRNLLKDAELTLSQFEGDDDAEEKMPVALVKKLGELNITLDYLRTQFLIYESPHLRKSYIEELKKQKSEVPEKKRVEVIWNGGNFEYLRNIYDQVSKNVSSDTVIKITNNFTGALDSDSANIMIFEGTYSIPRLQLPQMHLRGFGDVILNCGEPRSFLLNLTKDASLHSLKLNTSDVNNMIVVQRSILQMENCELDSTIPRYFQVTVQGILVLEGGTLIMENCTLLHLYTGLYVKKGGKAKLVNCCIKYCSVAVQMVTGSEVIMENCKFFDFNENAIRYDETSSRSLPEMESAPGLTIINCEFVGNNEKVFAAVSELSEFQS